MTESFELCELEGDDFTHRMFTLFVVRKITPMSLIKKLTLSSGIACLLLPMLPWAAVAQDSVQVSPSETMDPTEAIVDQIFLSDAPLPGANTEEQQNRIKIKTEAIQWLGRYQGVQKDGDHYLVLFEQGSVPITMEFRENGDPDAINVVACPVTEVPIAQAPSEYRETLLTECPDLNP
jgi:hypothetical protein